jgi:hypothetical protein
VLLKTTGADSLHEFSAIQAGVERFRSPGLIIVDAFGRILHNDGLSTKTRNKILLSEERFLLFGSSGCM